MVDKRIFIVGYGLYGSSSGAADYNVRIELKKYGEVSVCVCMCACLGPERKGFYWSAVGVFFLCGDVMLYLFFSLYCSPLRLFSCM